MTNLNEWAARWGVGAEALEDLRRMMGTASPPVILDGAPLSEAASQQQIRLEAPKQGVRLWRNNNGATMDETGRLIRYGLANDSAAMSRSIKSSDLIGITPTIITQVHVGQTVGIFTSIEVKRPGWVYKGTPREAAQLKWINLVLSFGGRAQFATGPGDVWT